MSRRRVPVMLALVLVACRPDTVRLDYRFSSGSELHFTMVAGASASWDIGGPGQGSYEIEFDVVEHIESVDEDTATVRVEMTPTRVAEDGLPSPGAKPRSFTLQVGDSGEVLQVIEVDGVSATALDPEELAFIGTYRPPLPLEPIRLGDSWESKQQLALSSVFQESTTTGTLTGLAKEGSADVAHLEYSGGGPLVWTTELPQGGAQLTGEAETSAAADFDLTNGYLRAAESSTEGRFDVQIEGEEGGVPLSGSLELSLDLELTRA